MNNLKTFSTTEEVNLEFPKRCLEYLSTIPYPDGFEVGSWWADIQRRNRDVIRNFESSKEAILYAQDGLMSGFDHRVRNYQSVVNFKAQELERTFPGFTLEGHQDLRESSYSDPESLVEIKGSPYSNIFLTHINFYLRSTLNFGQGRIPNNIIEIGGGYGALARIFKIMNPSTTYTIIDLPESLFFAQVFLLSNFPDAKICYVDRNEMVDINEFDFVLVPVQFCNAIAGSEFDIIINTGNFQEMPDTTVKFWMDFIENIIKVKMFYSFNYFLNDKNQFQETGGEKANLICPILDSFWRIKYFKINPALITVDAGGRNWLELCIERKESKQQCPDALEQEASALIEKAKLYPQGSNDWFENIWMTFWYKPQKQIAEELLKGIAIFKKGKGAKNNTSSMILCDPSSLRDVARLVKRFMAYWYRYLTKAKNNIYGEELYYIKSINSSEQ